MPAAPACTPSPPAAAYPEVLGRVLGSSLGGHRPEGHDQEAVGKDSLPAAAPTCPPAEPACPPIWGHSWLLLQTLLHPPQPQTTGRLPPKEDGIARSFFFPIRTLLLSSPGRPSSCSSLATCMSHLSREGKGGLLTPRWLGAQESTPDPTGICVSLHVSREIWFTMSKCLGEQYLSRWEDLRALGWGNKAFVLFNMSHPHPSHVHGSTKNQRHPPCLPLKPWSSKEHAGYRRCQDNNIAERDFIDFVLSPNVYIKASDILTVIMPSLLGLLCRRQSPRARHMERAWCLEAMTCPISRTAHGCRWQPLTPTHCLANLGRPQLQAHLPVLRHRPSLLPKLCLARESGSHRPLHKPTPTTTALLRKIIHWCLKVPQTGASDDFMTNFPQRHQGRQSLMLCLALTPCECLSAITTGNRAWSLHIILLLVHKFPLKGFQHPHTASSQAFKLLQPSQPDRMVPRNYKQHGTIFYYNTQHYYF